VIAVEALLLAGNVDPALVCHESPAHILLSLSLSLSLLFSISTPSVPTPPPNSTQPSLAVAAALRARIAAAEVRLNQVGRPLPRYHHGRSSIVYKGNAGL